MARDPVLNYETRKTKPPQWRDIGWAMFWLVVALVIVFAVVEFFAYRASFIT